MRLVNYEKKASLTLYEAIVWGIIAGILGVVVFTLGTGAISVLTWLAELFGEQGPPASP